MYINVLPEGGFPFPTGYSFFRTEHLASSCSEPGYTSPPPSFIYIFKPLLCPGIKRQSGPEEGALGRVQ